MSVQGRYDAWSTAREKAMADSPARRRLELLFDPGTFVELDGFAGGQQASGVVCGYGAVMESPVYAFVQDSSRDSGAVGAVQGKKIAKLYELALKTGAPVVGVYDSMGARISEGVDALDAYGEILRRVNSLSGVVPQIALVLGTCAGVSAMLACSADFVVMSEAGELFLTPPDLTENGAGGTAKDAMAAGVAHIVKPDEQSACEAVRGLLCRLPLNNLSTPPVSAFVETDGGGAALQAAAMAGPDQQKPEDLVNALCDSGSVVELLEGFGPCTYTALATMGGLPCGVVATRPGKIGPDGSAKAAKLVAVCDSYQIPVITLVNTQGFVASSAGAVREMARLAHVYAEATTPKVSVITGEAYGAAYVALCSRAASADYTVAWPGAVISALAPRTAVAFLHGEEITAGKSREQVEEEYADTQASALAAAATGSIDDVIDPAVTRPALLSALDLLSAKRVSRNPKKHSNMPM